ncbi:hypothetical protein HDV00_008034 [Rhizophlyctis rosea]|nr:hypothetical protein HDV00_008034 [Rhizophlyctis rosea]
MLMILAAIFAFRTRRVSSAYNENVFTVAAIGVIAVTSIVVVPVLQILTSPTASYMLIALGTVLGTLAPTLIFAIPKLFVAYNIFTVDPEVDPSIKGTTLRTASLIVQRGSEMSQDNIATKRDSDVEEDEKGKGITLRRYERSTSDAGAKFA